MRRLRMTLGLMLIAGAFTASADPALECGVGAANQIEVAACLAETEASVDMTVETALGLAMNTAKELDQVTRRDVAVAALEKGQSAWSAYRDAECDYVGSTFGGGSGTGVAIRSCRIEIGRARATDLMRFAR